MTEAGLAARDPGKFASTIGSQLRQERLNLGLSLQTVSLSTKIASRFLDAIENDDFSQLPGLVFARNFVRQFALALNIDPEPLLARIPRFDEATAKLPDPHLRSQAIWYASIREERRGKSLSFAVYLGLAVIAAFAAWLHFGSSRRTEAVSHPTPGIRQQSARLIPSKSPAPTVSEANSVPEHSVTQESGQPSSTRQLSDAAVRVTIAANDVAWIQVSADGKVVFTGTLQPQEIKEIAAAHAVRLLTGNAGGVALSLNEKALAPIGPPGQVRTVILTAAGPEFPSKASPNPAE